MACSKKCVIWACPCSRLIPLSQMPRRFAKRKFPAYFDPQKASHSKQVIRIHSKKEIHMKTLQKFGGFAALYMAAAYLIGIVLFLVVLDYPSITDPAQKVFGTYEERTDVAAKMNIFQ